MAKKEKSIQKKTEFPGRGSKSDPSKLPGQRHGY